MMKDTVLLIQLVAVVGGMDSILKDPSDFMSAVSFYLINRNYNEKHQLIIQRILCGTMKMNIFVF